jgi:integrase
VDRGAPAYARNVLDAIRAVFGFAIDRGALEVSPCAMLKPARIAGAKRIRTRVLDDGELRAVWEAVGGFPYPFGPMVQALMLTGGRLNEVAGARWREFDLGKRAWTIPPERFKSDTQHVVPLSDDMMALLANLPQWTKGDHLFSATYGVKAVSGFSKAKARIDERVGVIPRWTFHDVRRTVRTRLSELRVPEPIAELVIGHGRKGLARVYDQHKYVDEMREALDRWATRLRSITSSPPDNVVALHKAVAP